MEEPAKFPKKARIKKKKNGLRMSMNEPCAMRDIQSESYKCFEELRQEKEGRYHKPNPNPESLAQNNCQLVLMPSVESVAYLEAFNSHIPFENVLFFLKPISDTEEEVSCPICLDFPCAPIITKCGHVFCWKCIVCCLLSNELTESCYCPICHYYLNKDCLKIIIWRYINDLKVGDNVSMSLCFRDVTSSFVKLVNDENVYQIPTIFDGIFEMKPSFWIIPYNEDRLSQNWSVFLTRILAYPINDSIVTRILESYRLVMDEQLSSSLESSLESKALVLALGSLGDLKEKIVRNKDRNSFSHKRPMPENGILFYQSKFGHNVFLHPTNVHQICSFCTKSQKLTINESPKCISGDILNIKKQSIKIETYKRYKFLSHLPLKTEFTLILLHITTPSLPIPEFSMVNHVIIEECKEIEEETYLYPRDSLDICIFSSDNTKSNSFSFDYSNDTSDDFPSIST